jgi:adenylylsulfate kinase
MIESKGRSIAKAVSWRAFGSATTAGIAWVLTRRAEVALLAGGADAVIKVALFFVHERLWNRLPFGRRLPAAKVIWLTGLPASGKSTLARELVARLEALRLPVEHLDGDAVRSLFPATGFDRAGREEHIRRVGHLASRLKAHGVWVVASLVSPYRESRQFVRGICGGDFVEVHVCTPLQECERRDPKGLYRRARAGELTELTGVQAPYEEPEHPEVRVDAAVTPPAEGARAVLGVALR